MSSKNIYIIGAIVISTSLVAGSAIGARFAQAAMAPSTKEEEHAYQIQQALREANEPCRDSVKECATRFERLKGEMQKHVSALGGPDNLTFGRNVPAGF